jgi:hypothetical protein
MNFHFFYRDFAKTELPAIAKIVKGQQHNLGVPTLSNPSLQSTALFLSAGKKYQILAQPIKIKDGRKSTNVGEFESPLPTSKQQILMLFFHFPQVPKC